MDSCSPNRLSPVLFAFNKAVATATGRPRCLLAAILLSLPAISPGQPGFCLADQPSEPATAAVPSDVRWITYNIRCFNRGDGPDHWDNRVDSVAELLKTGDLAEATRAQIDGLAQRLSEFDWYGLGRDDARDAGEFSPIFWRKDRFKAGQSGTFWLGPDTTAVGKPAWEARISRICSWVILEPLASDGSATGKTFAVFNTHFDHQSGLTADPKTADGRFASDHLPVIVVVRF